MKILAFAQFGTMNGGANRSFLMVLERLKNVYGHEIKVITPNHGHFNDALNKLGIDNKIIAYHEISGVNTFSPRDIYRFGRFHLYSLIDRRVARKFAKSLKQEKYDLVYINDTDVYFGAYVARYLNIPYVWHFRSFVNPKAHFICDAKRMYSECSKIIAISHGMEKTLVSNPILPSNIIKVIHNGIPLPDNQILADRSRAEGLHMVQCGRISKEKGHIDAIGALKILRDEGKKDIFLHIVGATVGGESDIYLNHLKALIEENELLDQVVFEGTIDDMMNFRKNMHIELMCSVSEPFGRVTLEGMRSGLVVIGSNTGGTPEIINDSQTGLLYKQGDCKDLASKIRIIYDDKGFANYLVNNAIGFSYSHFTPEQNVAAIEQELRLACQ